MSGFKGAAAGRDGPVHQASSDPPGASWNYRLIEFVDFDGSPWLAIHEVHYRDGVPFGYGERPADASSEDAEGIAWVLDQMGKALLRPALRETDFTSGALEVGPINPAETAASSPSEASAGNPATDEQTLPPPSPGGEQEAVNERDAFEAWALADHRCVAPEGFEERTPDNGCYYADDSVNHAYIGWRSRAALASPVRGAGEEEGGSARADLSRASSSPSQSPTGGEG